MHCLELTAPKQTSKWLCTICDTIWTDKQSADRCCSQMGCFECGRNVWNGGSRCRDCKPGDRGVLEKLLFTRASKVYYHEYEEPYIFWEPGGKRPGVFFKNKSQIEALCVDREIPTPTWIWGCKAEPVRLSVDSLIPVEQQHLVPEPDLEALQLYLNGWVDAQKLNTYKCDHSVAVILDSTLMSEFRPIRSSDLL